MSRLLAVLLLVLPLVLIASCEDRPTQLADEFTADPILTLGHGAIFGADGKELKPDADFIRRAQRYYIAALMKEPPGRGGEARVTEEEMKKTSDLIHQLVSDEVLADALFLDWLIGKTRPENTAHLTSVNNALRWYYYLKIRQQPPPEADRWTKGIDPERAKELDAGGVPTTVFLKTTAGGVAYIDECRKAGVPVPVAMFSAEWTLRGVFDKEFISESSQAELWLHTSKSPPGFCLALPRYPPAGGGGFSDDASLLGIICLGTQSNKACFFDNPRGRTFRRGLAVGLDQFVGGVDLVANAQGVCTDCHAGENPYVVHPEKPPFSGLSLLPAGWPDPLVDASWPQNPGPTNLLDAVSSTQQCTSCHSYGSAGRFPDVSTQLPGYCGTVLETAMNEDILALPSPPDPTKRTMPPFGMDRNQFVAHIAALKAACKAPPTGGGVVIVVDVQDDPSFISPPIVIDPLYQCAQKVAVRGGILNAQLELFINGSPAGSRIARNPNKEEFNVPALVAGQVVTAKQTLNGVPSGPSAAITVRDHKVDFPAGLPAPAIDPTLIHECGDIIAVRHVPGANLTVFSNGADPLTFGTSTGWTAVNPAKHPFVINDSFTAQAELCADKSPVSGDESAVEAPKTLPALHLNPSNVYAGQELVTVENIVYGARVRIDESTFGPVADFTWPVSWYPDYDVASALGRPLQAGDLLITSQELCAPGPKQDVPPALPCDQLPAPRIRHPLVGQNYVVVTESVPGARIHVYDSGNVELGDGSGTVILLKRAITGADVLTVVQQVGKCTSKSGYRVSVRNQG
ncbi:MAG: hypothetical protein ABUT39_03270 [Acidobacteriota bacterium]